MIVMGEWDSGKLRGRERRVWIAIRKAAEAPGYKPGALKNDFTAVYRLRVKFYADEKALGFRCAAPPRKPSEG